MEAGDGDDAGCEIDAEHLDEFVGRDPAQVAGGAVDNEAARGPEAQVAGSVAPEAKAGQAVTVLRQLPIRASRGAAARANTVRNLVPT